MQFAALQHISAGSSQNIHRARRKSRLQTAESYSWEPQTTVAVLLSSRSIPNETVIAKEMLPGNGSGWWWFGNALPIYPYATNEPFCALLWGVDQRELNGAYVEALEISGIVMNENGRPAPSISWVWPFGTSLRQAELYFNDPQSRMTGVDKFKEIDAISRKACTEATRFFAAACAWLSQRIVCTSSGHVERHRRKQLLREHNAIVSDVKVIQLRRRESRTHILSETSERVDWNYRWIVNGHWRNQPYANGEHKLIYILPYVKGPEDKPLKVPSQTVYAVHR